MDELCVLQLGQRGSQHFAAQLPGGLCRSTSTPFVGAFFSPDFDFRALANSDCTPFACPECLFDTHTRSHYHFMDEQSRGWLELPRVVLVGRLE